MNIIIKDINRIETLKKNEIRVRKNAEGTTLYISDKCWKDMLLRSLGIEPEDVIPYSEVKLKYLANGRNLTHTES